VSFETLEHLSAQEEFLREVKRALWPSGLLVISIPDHEFFAGSPPNPFHLKELVRAGWADTFRPEPHSSIDALSGY
jgi:SAM-dependent methyltransferase